MTLHKGGNKIKNMKNVRYLINWPFTIRLSICHSELCSQSFWFSIFSKQHSKIMLKLPEYDSENDISRGHRKNKICLKSARCNPLFNGVQFNAM